MTTTQLGLFGTDYAVSPTCADCGRVIGETVRNGLDGEPLCADCFNNADLVVCPTCEDTFDRADCTETPDGELWCEECVDAETVECAACNDRIWNDDAVEVVRRRGWRGNRETDHLCESCADDDTTVCDDCGDQCYRDDSHTTTGDYDVCDWCYETSYSTCEDCGRAVHHDDCVCTDYSCYCSDCRPHGGDFGPAGFRNRSGRITEIGSARCFGVELETDDCDGYTELDGDPAWGAKDDCTVSGKEFYSDILDGDEGLDAVRAWAKLADCNGWSAGYNAGYHLHLDMRNESDDSLYAIAYAYRACQEVWLAFVPERRSNGSYSHTCRWGLRDVTESAEERSFYSWAGRGTRYNWINCTAYTQHNTFEVRAHHGTCDGDEVCNWIKAHTRFADWASNKGLAGVQEALGNLSDAEKFDLIAREAWQDDELRDYYAEKADEYNGIRF